MTELANPAVLEFKPQEITDPFEHFASLDFYKQQNARLLSSLNLKKGDVVLDLACGPGNLSVGIAQAVGGEGMIVAADMSDVALEAARKNLKGYETPVHFMQVEGEKVGDFLDPLAGKFDSIVCGNALHNFPDKEKTFESVVKLLKPGGVFAFNSTFWDGAIPESEMPFYTRWLKHAAVRALQTSKQDGIEVKDKGRAEARKQLTAGEWFDMFEKSGLRNVDLYVSDVKMPLEGFVAISLDREFINGTMHRFRPDVASKSLEEAAPEVFRDMGKEHSVRKWLQISAVK